MKFKEIVKIINDEGVILTDYQGNEIEKADLGELLNRAFHFFFKTFKYMYYIK